MQKAISIFQIFCTLLSSNLTLGSLKESLFYRYIFVRRFSFVPTIFSSKKHLSVALNLVLSEWFLVNKLKHQFVILIDLGFQMFCEWMRSKTFSPLWQSSSVNQIGSCDIHLCLIGRCDWFVFGFWTLYRKSREPISVKSWDHVVNLFVPFKYFNG